MKLYPVKMNQNELVGLLTDKENYDRKLSELNKLLIEINSKIAIANSIRESDKLRSQAEALMKESAAFRQELLDKEKKLEQFTDDKLKSLQKREDALCRYERVYVDKKRELESSLNTYHGRVKELDKKIAMFDLKCKKENSKQDDNRKELHKRIENLNIIAQRALSDLGRV